MGRIEKTVFFPGRDFTIVGVAATVVFVGTAVAGIAIVVEIEDTWGEGSGSTC
jgi:hypothetical protein